MKHIQRTIVESALCGGFQDGDRLVLAAFESDCEKCRAKVMVQPPKNGKAEREPLAPWTPEPYLGAETMLEEKQRKVDGQ